jgi:phosphomannomutase
MIQKLFIFDVDGVLCDRSMPIDPEFKKWFLIWAKRFKHSIYYLTGSNREKTELQIGKEMLELADISFHCLGNSVWIDGRENIINTFQLNQDEINWLESKVKASPYPEKTGKHIEPRTGSVNFSIVGRNATVEQRLRYKQYDEETNERITILQEFIKTFPHFDAFVGGDISIDICLRGAHKGLALKYAPWNDYHSIYAFGDKGMEYGVDYPLSKFKALAYRYIQIDNGYKETWEILKNL